MHYVYSILPWILEPKHFNVWARICIFLYLDLLESWDFLELGDRDEHALYRRAVCDDVAEEAEADAFDDFWLTKEIAFLELLEAVAIIVINDPAFTMSDEKKAVATLLFLVRSLGTNSLDWWYLWSLFLHALLLPCIATPRCVRIFTSTSLLTSWSRVQSSVLLALCNRLSIIRELIVCWRRRSPRTVWHFSTFLVLDLLSLYLFSKFGSSILEIYLALLQGRWVLRLRKNNISCVESLVLEDLAHQRHYRQFRQCAE